MIQQKNTIHAGLSGSASGSARESRGEENDPRPFLRTRVDIRIVAVAAFLAASCAPFEKNPIPGADNNVVRLEGIEVSTVLAAMRYQIATAIEQTDKIKEKYPGSSISKLVIMTGSGKLTATVKSVKTNSGSLKGVIPFSGFEDTAVTPSLEGSLSAESTRIEEFAFKITPEKKTNLVPVPQLANIKIGDTLRKAIVERYEDILRIPVAPAGTSYGPLLTPQSITMTLDFVAQRKGNGTVEIKFTPPKSAAFAEVGPAATADIENTVSNQLLVVLPFDTNDASDPRKLFYAVKGAAGTLYVEEPFTTERYRKLKATATAQVPKMSLVEKFAKEMKLQNFPPGQPVPFVVPYPVEPESSMEPEEGPDPF